MNCALILNFKNMSGKIHFSETEVWKDVVLKTYSLKHQKITIQGQVFQFIGNGKLWSNSPYITSGGHFSFKNEIAKKDIIINEPILIKSSSEIKFNSDLKPILVKDYFTYILDLSGGKEEIWSKKLSTKSRNQVRKSEKFRYTKKIGGLELLEDYYQLISTAWRDLGTPTHSKDFYKNIIKECDGNKGIQACFIVLYDGDLPVSGACLIFDADTIYHPYAATLKVYNKYSLNNALYWNIILFALEKNLIFFDIGRSRKTQGTSKYKLTWGAEEQQLYYYYLNKDSHNNDEDGKFIHFLINMWKKLPLKIANFLGPKLIYKVLK